MALRCLARRVVIALCALIVCFIPLATAFAADAGQPSVSQDLPSYLPGDTITFTGSNWTPGETVNISFSSDPSAGGTTVHATADDKGSFTATATMPDASAPDADRPDTSSFTATATSASTGASAQTQFGVGHAPVDAQRIIDAETYWNHRVTYPTGKFNPEWVRSAANQDRRIHRGTPGGRRRFRSLTDGGTGTQSLTLGTGNNASQSFFANLFASSNSFIPLGPQPEHMTGCSGCFDYGTTEGRVNAIIVDPTTTTPGSITAFIGTVGGGVWKTTNCCTASTSWTVTTDDPLISTTAIDSLTFDPNNHNNVYAGTGDLNYGSFSMGSQGILKSIDGGASWTVKGADVFGPAYTEAVGNFPQYDAVGKVRVDPNSSNTIAAGTKKGFFVSRDGGDNWTGPCLIGPAGQRQDVTGLELTNMGAGNTRIIAAVGVRGFATTVQFDLNLNGANGIYSATMPPSGCPTFTSIASNTNGFVFGTAVTGSPYTTGAALNAGSGAPYVSPTSGNQLGRIDIAVAPSNPNVVYAQVGSIAPNNNSGCGNANGCQLGVFASTDGGATWNFMAGSAGGSLRNCAGGNTSGNPGDYPQNWYDQGMAVDPNNADRLIVDTYDSWFATRTGTAFFNISCGYNGSALSAHVVHVDHHALAFLPGSSSTLLEGSDGGIFGTTNADTISATTRPTWFNMDNGLNTIEFYSGDISGNFATSPAPMAAGGAQDNGPSSATFAGAPTGGVQWQMGTGGDGFSGKIDPIGTGTSLRVWEGNNSGGFSRCISNCSSPGATWSSKRGAWTGDLQSFILPVDLFHGGIAGGDDCPAAGPSGGCGHLLAGTTRVWETITGNAPSTVTWYITDPVSHGAAGPGLTKGTLGNRSFINQVKYSPKRQSVAIVGTNDGNVQFGFNLGTGVANQAVWVDVTGGNAILPNRPILGIAVDPTTDQAPIGYAAVGGFNENTPSTPGHIFRVVCTTNCASSTWTDKSGNLPNIPVDSVIANPNFPQQVFAGTDFGLYFTDDVTAQSPVWQRFSNLPAVMIWDMAIDRGATTLSLWTRGRGAFAWALPTGPEQPLPTSLVVPSFSGVYGGSVNLTATLTSGGNPVAGKTVTFTVNGGGVGSAITDVNGVATLTYNITIGGGTWPVVASFAGDSVYAPATGSNTLTVTALPANLLTTASLVKNGDNSYTATVSVKNNGSGPAVNVVLTAATLGTPSGTPLPQSLGDIAPGGTATTTVNFPASAGSSGATVIEKYSGTYTSGTFGASIRARLP